MSSVLIASLEEISDHRSLTRTNARRAGPLTPASEAITTSQARAGVGHHPAGSGRDGNPHPLDTRRWHSWRTHPSEGPQASRPERPGAALGRPDSVVKPPGHRKKLNVQLPGGDGSAHTAGRTPQSRRPDGRGRLSLNEREAARAWWRAASTIRWIARPDSSGSARPSGAFGIRSAKSASEGVEINDHSRTATTGLPGQERVRSKPALTPSVMSTEGRWRRCRIRNGLEIPGPPAQQIPHSPIQGLR